MAIEVTAKLTCDMCGREETVALREAWRSGRLEAEPASVAKQAPHWELLGKEGYPIKDFRDAGGKLLCEGCANVYRDTIKRQGDELAALFS